MIRKYAEINNSTPRIELIPSLCRNELEAKCEVKLQPCVNTCLALFFSVEVHSSPSSRLVEVPGMETSQDTVIQKRQLIKIVFDCLESCRWMLVPHQTGVEIVVLLPLGGVYTSCNSYLKLISELQIMRKGL